jgi:hypothetical protein
MKKDSSLDAPLPDDYLHTIDHESIARLVKIQRDVLRAVSDAGGNVLAASEKQQAEVEKFSVKLNKVDAIKFNAIYDEEMMAHIANDEAAISNLTSKLNDKKNPLKMLLTIVIILFIGMLAVKNLLY